MILEVKKTAKAKLQKYFGGITHAISTMVKLVVTESMTETFNFNTPITDTFNLRSDITNTKNMGTAITGTFDIRSDIE